MREPAARPNVCVDLSCSSAVARPFYLIAVALAYAARHSMLGAQHFTGDYQPVYWTSRSPYRSTHVKIIAINPG